MLPYKQKDEIKYMRQNAPNCIKNISNLSLKDLQKKIENSYGNNTSVFGIKCTCGNDSFHLKLPQDIGIVEITCSKCKLKFIIFDPNKHGYNGALHLIEDLMESDKKEYLCRKCNSFIFSISSGFQYSGETDVLQEDDTISVKPEELFGWFILESKCTKCGNIEKSYDSECA